MLVLFNSNSCIHLTSVGFSFKGRLPIQTLLNKFTKLSSVFESMLEFFACMEFKATGGIFIFGNQVFLVLCECPRPLCVVQHDVEGLLVFLAVLRQYLLVNVLVASLG